MTQDPQAHLQYGLDWSASLPDGDTIADSEWFVPEPLQKGADSRSTTETYVYISGGEAGRNYLVTNRITTTPSAEVDERSIVFKIREL